MRKSKVFKLTVMIAVFALMLTACSNSNNEPAPAAKPEPSASVEPEATASAEPEATASVEPEAASTVEITDIHGTVNCS